MCVSRTILERIGPLNCLMIGNIVILTRQDGVEVYWDSELLSNHFLVMTCNRNSTGGDLVEVAKRDDVCCVSSCQGMKEVLRTKSSETLGKQNWRLLGRDLENFLISFRRGRVKHCLLYHKKTLCIDRVYALCCSWWFRWIFAVGMFT